MNKEKYQKLRDKIIEANSDIRELKFGCKVIHQDSYYFVHNKQNENIIIGEYNPTKCIDLSNCRNYKIIGRDITLEDVLKTFMFHSIFYFIGYHGQFLESVGSKREYRETDVFWQLNKKLEEQSDECLDFLANLLK